MFLERRRKEHALRDLLVACSIVMTGCSSTGGAAVEPGRDSGAEPDAQVKTDSAGVDAKNSDARQDVDVIRDTDANGAPSGWQEYTGWSTECPLYVPGPNGTMPEPIEWEPCKAPLPENGGCRKMKHTWYDGGGALGGAMDLSLDPVTGEPVLFFTRWNVNGNVNVAQRVVAEADGRVRNAFLQLNAEERLRGGDYSFKCWMGTDDLADGRYLMTVYETNETGTTEGAVAGEVGVTLPSTVIQRPVEGKFTSSWWMNARWIFRLSPGWMTVTPWDLSRETDVYSPSIDADGLSGYDPIMVNEDVFIVTSSLSHCGEVVWNERKGLQPLLRWYGDTTRGAGHFGTDGKDMVWTYAEGPHACDRLLAERTEIWTAPYTTDASELKATARRLRTDLTGLGPFPYVVGFGYAGRPVSGLPAPHHEAMLVVRMSDGRSWLIPGAPIVDDLAWDRVLGFTKDEMFAQVVLDKMGSTIVRIRLDSLGPGVDPD